ncbi:type II secretion system F family protein [Nocardioides sp.]|uniref:type II secretion system F family protein n=1 Tax=Nocardioides sp. TaxID=35761 RepID=UPI00261D4DC7|nr:type II secretion system F family protein [Nocardioides sp.]
MPVLTAAVACGGAVVLIVPGGFAVPQPRGGLGAVGLLGVAVALAWAQPHLAVLLVGLGCGLPAVIALVVRRRRDRAAAATSQRLVEVCEQVASELSAGLAPGVALARAAQAWPVLAPVAEAARVGMDVPEVMRGLATTTPGAERLRVVAAAWQVAHASGGPVAAALDGVALELREGFRAQRVIDGELASARATARLVAFLPLAALAMGSGVGGDPWRFLLETPIGLGCGAAGVLLGLVGVWWIDAIARAVSLR